MCVCTYCVRASHSLSLCGVILLIRAARESKSDARAIHPRALHLQVRSAAINKNSRRAPRHKSYSVPSCNRNKKANALCTRGARELSAALQLIKILGALPDTRVIANLFKERSKGLRERCDLVEGGDVEGGDGLSRETHELKGRHL